MKKKKMQCVIRLDDITADMDWIKFTKAEQILDTYGIKPLLGVVPDNRDENLHRSEKCADFAERLEKLKKKGWVFAQHGMNHVYTTEDSGILGLNPFSEFAGESYDVQKNRLIEGREILRSSGIDTDIFMAPGHTYDRNTVKALKETGFTTVTDGLFYKPYLDGEILFVPCRMHTNFKIKGFDTVCMHTNLMKEEDFKNFEKFCRENSDSIVSFQPEKLRAVAVKRNAYVRLYEKTALKKRQIKNAVAGSKKLAWYMEWTDHKNSMVKWATRFLCLPVLIFKKVK